MHARDLARPCASVSADEALLRASELLAGEGTTALLVVTREGHPIALLDGHHLLAGILPDSAREDPLRATVLADRLDGEVRQSMAALTVADVLPRRRPALALVGPHASPLQMAAVMARTGSPSSPSSSTTPTTGRTCWARSRPPRCSPTSAEPSGPCYGGASYEPR